MDHISKEDIDACACRALWCAVIKEQWQLAFQPLNADRDHEITAARRWFGGRDFVLAVTLVGLDPAWVFEGFQRRLAATEGGGGD